MILCVGKSEELLLKLQAALKGARHNPFLCIQLEDALRVLRFQLVEIVIADDALISKPGRALIDQARAFTPRVPVVLWTSLEPSRSVAEMDPDVVISQSDGINEVLRIVAILQGKATSKEDL